jgi:TRAP-type C4-dicarboxylate transport system substrate-binding protein
MKRHCQETISRRCICRSATAALAIGIAAALTAGFSAPAHAQIVMKVSTATVNDAQHEWIKRFVATVNKASGGKIAGEAYSASQLGSIPRQIEAVQLGAVQGWVGPAEFLAGVDRRFEVLSAAGVFVSTEQARNVLMDETFSKAFLKIGEPKGVVGVGLFVGGPNVIATRKPVDKIAGLKGLKIRVLASTVQLEQMKKLGATPLPMALGEVLPAIQQGTIDGLMTSIPVMTAFKYYDAAPDILETNHSYIISIATLSRRWLDSLPADLKKIVLDSATSTTVELYPWIVNMLTNERKAWTAHGGRITPVPAADRTAMMADLEKTSASVFASEPAVAETYRALIAAANRAK